MSTYLLTVAILFGLLLVGVLVDRLYRRFAARHPELGPYRQPGCSCCDHGCETADCDSGSCDSGRR